MSIQIGAEIFKKALSYPTRLIAKNAGVNGNIVVKKVSAYKHIVVLLRYKLNYESSFGFFFSF